MLSIRRVASLFVLVLALVGCAEKPGEKEGAPLRTVGESFAVVPGLSASIVRRGYGKQVQPGDIVDVHYTGWLYDPAAEGNRGRKFDSSVDRGQRFQFPVGAGHVIRGWDEGVNGMLVGEVRELTIAPQLAYGAPGRGNVIPPNATLIFEIELFGIEAPFENAQ